MSPATPASSFQLILRPQLAPSSWGLGQTGGGRSAGCRAPSCTEGGLSAVWCWTVLGGQAPEVQAGEGTTPGLGVLGCTAAPRARSSKLEKRACAPLPPARPSSRQTDRQTDKQAAFPKPGRGKPQNGTRAASRELCCECECECVAGWGGREGRGEAFSSSTLLRTLPAGGEPATAWQPRPGPPGSGRGRTQRSSGQ